MRLTKKLQKLQNELTEAEKPDMSKGRKKFPTAVRNALRGRFKPDVEALIKKKSPRRKRVGK